jgi:SEC-C motif
VKPGRNDPCHCGSGKKYKHCHLPSDEAPAPGDVTWRRLQSATEKLTPALLRFADEHFGASGLDEAWFEFNLYEDVPPFEEDDPALPLFFPWFFYNWLPDPEETETPEAAHSITAADAYLRANGHRLDPLARQYIDRCLDAEMSFHQVVSCRRSNGFRLRDVMLGTEIDVIERIGSDDARPGDILYCKVVPIEDIAVLDGCGSALLPPIWKPLMIELRAEMRRAADRQGPLGVGHLREWDFDLRELYLQIEGDIFDPPVPGALNADGELIESHRLIYEIESAEEIFDALKDLEADTAETELEERVERDHTGALQRAMIFWQASDKPDSDDPLLAMLGSMLIFGNRLTAIVNSAARAKRLGELIEARVGARVRQQPTIIMPVETVWLRSGLPDPDDLDAGALAEQLRDWVDTPIAALIDRTPRAAVADPDGREAVEALLMQIERDGAELSPPLDPAVVVGLRETLGL